MEKLTQLITSLDKSEIGMVRRFYAFNKKNDILLRDKLFEIILEDPNVSYEILKKKIKKNTTNASFLMLQKRLLSDILKVLIVSQGPKKFVSKYFEARYKCDLLIVEIDVLKNRGGVNQLVIDKIIEAERLANKYELNDLKLIINDHKKETLGLRKGPNAYNKAASERFATMINLKDLSEAQDYFRKLTIPDIFVKNKGIHYKDLAKEATAQLNALSKKNPSAFIQAWYLRSEIFYNHLIHNYQTAEYFAFEFLEFVKKNKVVNASDNMGGAMMMISTISIYLENYDNAVKYAKEGIPYFFNGSINQATISELLYFAYLRTEQYSEVELLINYINSFKNIKKNQFVKSKWQFFKANLLFQQGHFNEALSILQKQSELLSDKSGWRLGYKIMEMMCIIELDTCDWLDYRIETFRKLLSTVKNENIHRPKLILHIIKQFIKNAYDIKATSKKCEEQLNLLRKGEEEYRYDARGYEIIRFDKWWDAKLNKKLQRN